MHYIDTANNWGEFYSDAAEKLPPNITNLPPRRSVTGILLFVSNTPVKWMSKKLKSRRRWKLSQMALNLLQHV